MNISKYVNAIRSLGLQSIMEAKQGHPGMVVSAAPITYSVYANEVNISVDNPNWINRDRVVLSAGHGSMSLYPILHFCGLLSMEDMKHFRHRFSKTPGHPESYVTPFIDATTGPLGQGVSNAVGMAIAEVYLRHEFAKLPGLIDHYTYCIVGDGDLQEGISYEAMSLAGKLKLNKLIMLHDSNRYQLESSVDMVNIENLQKRVESMGWLYLSCDNNPQNITRCIDIAKRQVHQPCFIEIHTEIGEGLTFADSYEAHGGGIKESEIESFNKHFDCDFDNWTFDKDVYEHFEEKVIKKGTDKYKNWVKLLQYYKLKQPEETEKFIKQARGEFTDWKEVIDINALPKDVATRAVAGKILEQIQNAGVKDTIILSPDVSKSTSIKFKGEPFNENRHSSYIMTGIREFAMSGIQNGILLHRGLRCISSSFMAFSDYFKAGIRLGAISKLPSVYVLTHDSILLGSDGPTHQPVEHLAGLRAMPNVEVLRPCDEVEVYAAFIEAMSSVDTTYCIVLTRQATKSGFKTSVPSALAYGGYLIYNNADNLTNLTILASGSEVALAVKTADFLLENYNLTSEVFSVPNLNKFVQTKDLKTTLDSSVGVFAIEAGNDSMWYRLAIYDSRFTTIEVPGYGHSMDGNVLYNLYGFNPQAIAYKVINSFLPTNRELIDKVNNDYLQFRNEFIAKK
ncbi:transketolase [Ureaplasma ceti]|uniref:Transketolase n=1 Tax=Ureaplasma ceti TaxID=3119530 RepID=A0ABP9U7B9_9BACT